MASALDAFLEAEAIGPPLDALDQGKPNNLPDGAANLAMPEAEPDPDAYPRDLDGLHQRLIRWFEQAERASMDARRLAERDADYFHGAQWTRQEEDKLRERGQPVLFINYIRRKVELLNGLERKARTDPKAYPRTPTEDERADAATAVLRYVADATKMPVLRSAVWQDMLIPGYGGIQLALEEDGRGGLDVTAKHIEWDRLWYDPHSRSLDFSDARHLGSVVWMDRDQLLDLIPDAEDVIGESFEPSADTYADRPGSVAWQDAARTRCRVVQCHWTERGRWWSATYTRAGLLAEPTPSPFKDARGRPHPPLFLASAYVDRENNRYGAVRDIVSLQDMINKFHSKAMHLLSVNRVIAEAGAVEDEDKARREAAKPDGFIRVNPGYKFEILTGGELAAGQFQLLQHATAEMQASGPNASMAGNDPRDLSGRAILAQQAGGAAQNEPLADSLRQWMRRVYETVWLACREHWSGERWIRVSDDMDSTTWLGLNRQVTLAQELGAMDPAQRAAAMQSMGLMPNDPRLGMVVRTENDISDLEVDITIEEGADVPAQQAEEFQALTQLIGSVPMLATPPVIEALVASSSLKSKAKLLEAMRGMQQAQAQSQAEQAPIQQAHAVAQVRDANAKADANEALARLRGHQAIHSVADVHRQAAESFAVPVGPVDHPNQLPASPAQAE